MRARRRTIQKKPLVAYILPLLTSILCIVLVVLAVNAWVKYTSTQTQDILQEKSMASFTVDAQNIFIVLDNKERRLSKDYTSSLYSGEGISTGASSRQYMEMTNKGYARLDEYSTLFFKKNDPKSEFVNLAKGNLWLKYEKESQDVKDFSLKTKNMLLTLEPGVHVAAGSTNGKQYLSVLQGKAQVKILDNGGKTIKEILLQSGKEVRFDAQFFDTQAVSPDTLLSQDISEDFMKSEWVDWNMVEDSKMSNYEPKDATVAETAATNSEAREVPQSNTNEPEASTQGVEVTNISSGDVFTTETINVRGDYQGNVSAITVNGTAAELNSSAGTWVAYKISLPKEGKNTITVKMTKEGETTTVSTFSVSRDSGVPDTPVLTSPRTISTPDSKIQGSVGKEVVKVTVNGYALKKFVPGSGSWQYILSLEIQNMKPGENLYRVIGYDKAGNASKPLNAVITYTGPTETSKVESNSNKNAKSASGTRIIP